MSPRNHSTRLTILAALCTLLASSSYCKITCDARIHNSRIQVTERAEDGKQAATYFYPSVLVDQIHSPSYCVYPPLTVPKSHQPPPPPNYYTKPPEHGVWCVAKPTAPDSSLQQALDYACASGADCEPIQLKGLCYLPNTVLAHASYAFNSYWQSTKSGGGTCEFGGSAMLVTVDPSYDHCHFIYS